MSKQDILGGTVHKLPADVRKALTDNSPVMLAAWQDITPLARNEFICWIVDAKKADTRARRIEVAQSKLESGQRRPCCWQGCPHREKNGK